MRHQTDYTSEDNGLGGILLGLVFIGGFIYACSGGAFVADLLCCMGIALVAGAALRNGYLLLRGVASEAETVGFLLCGGLSALLGLALGPTQLLLCGLGGFLVFAMCGKLGNDTINNTRYVRDAYDDQLGVTERRARRRRRLSSPAGQPRPPRAGGYRRNYHGGMGH